MANDGTLEPTLTQPRRTIVVQKYGGSSVADVERLGTVADRIVAAKRAGHDVVAVVSAMGKTTDQLLTLARQVTLSAEPPRRELDMLVSTGERVAMSLLSIAIQARGVEAISFTGSQCGIITNDRHFDARIIEVRPHRIEDELARGRVVIVAGYQGMSYRREITTLGRGGSDTTAVALAAALEAERCEIYSDVDGVYSADPRIVAEAVHLPEMSIDMLQEMAHAGAKVINAHAVEWARRAKIAIFARSTFDAPSDSPKETVVRLDAPTDVLARAVSCDRQVALFERSGPEASSLLLESLEAAALPVLAFEGSELRAHAVVSLISAPDWAAKRAELARNALVHEEAAFVSVVGPAIASEPAALAGFRRALVDLGVTPRVLAVAPLRLSALVDSARADDVQRALHAALVHR
ncbi:MAG: aspartate kinase [Deltaproteobacteria bacterium]|nr:aspartate kinase [Deltaproteobacteria bacterium]